VLSTTGLSASSSRMFPPLMCFYVFIPHVSETGVLTFQIQFQVATLICDSNDHSVYLESANILMNAFRPSSKLSEKGDPSSLIRKREPSPIRPAPVVGPPPSLPKVSSTSDNPLLAAFAKHRAKLESEPND
jgi:hypothetical protein